MVDTVDIMDVVEQTPSTEEDSEIELKATEKAAE